MLYLLSGKYFSAKTKMKNLLKKILEEEKGGAEIVAIILVIIVLIAVVVIFRTQLSDLVANLFNKIGSDVNKKL